VCGGAGCWFGCGGALWGGGGPEVELLLGCRRLDITGLLLELLEAFRAHIGAS
jgi:hypothetical protein